MTGRLKVFLGPKWASTAKWPLEIMKLALPELCVVLGYMLCGGDTVENDWVANHISTKNQELNPCHQSLHLMIHMKTYVCLTCLKLCYVVTPYRLLSYKAISKIRIHEIRKHAEGP